MQGMRHSRFAIGRRGKRPDYTVIACVVFLTVFGLVMLASASSNLGETKFGDPYFFLKRQLLTGFAVGAMGFLIAALVPYIAYEKFALPALLVGIGFLVLIFTPLGVTEKGATRWLTAGPITFQPSELLKLAFPLYLAAWLGRGVERRRKFWKGFFPFILVSGVIAGLLLAQHSTSIVGILLATALVVYFVSGARISYILGVFAIGALGIALVVYFTPYRLERVMNFWNQNTADPQGAGFHLTQARIAIGSGGLWGTGYGQSTTKISYLPEPIGDSIFAVIGEETGFVGSAFLITVFLVFVFRIFWLAWKARDTFARLLLVGFGSLIAIQVFVNIGAISGIIPLTGTPLPFVSYGGTALAVFLTMSGIIVNVSKHVS